MLVNKRQEERERDAGWSLEIAVFMLQAAGRQQFGWVGGWVWGGGTEGVEQKKWKVKDE